MNNDVLFSLAAMAQSAGLITSADGRCFQYHDWMFHVLYASTMQLAFSDN
jgi:hypothetical protein